MKKFTVLCLAGLLVLAFGAAASAQEVKLDFRASGSIDAQTFLTENVPPLQPNATPIYNSLGANYSSFNTFPPGTAGQPANALNRTVSYWDSRMSLRFEANMGKELSGVLQFEIDATRWGSTPTGNVGNFRDANNFGQWSTDRSAIELKYVYFDVGLPYMGIPVPMNVRLGAQPMAIRPWIFAATDGMGVSGGLKIDPVNINPFYFKPKEGTDWTNDDVDIYGVQVNAKVGTFTVGGYGAYYNMGSYPMFVASAPYAFDARIAPQIAGTYEANFWYMGLYGDGKLGPVDINFDAVYEWGKVRDRGSNGLQNVNSVPYAGWASRVKVDYPWEKFNFGAIGMYASGSDANKTSSTGLPGTSAADGTLTSRVNGYMVPVGSETGAANAESAVFYGMEAGASGGAGWAVNHNYNQMSKGAFGGSWFAKLYGSYKITPWYKITLQGLYIGDTTSHGNTYGTARKYPGTTSTLLRDNDFIGVELDLLNEIQIYKNLTFKVFGGYMWAGNATDLYNPGNLTNGVGSGQNWSMHNPWALRTRLLYTF
ncbi:MAG TPA: hypothetical protein VMV04_21745 [Thermodesulfobacteriota bacterium]|nr:hypothetical protein [Thermodesulfobacteriota bacterium]